MSEKFMIYCDMDGVLTDFNEAVLKYYNNDFLKNYPNFPKTNAKSASELHIQLKNSWYRVTESAPYEYWKDMKWMSDGKTLWDFIKKLDTIILSTPAQTEACLSGKKDWVRENLGEDISVILSQNKERYVEDSLHVPSKCLKRPRILIDDMQKKIDKWVEAGGIGILHKNADDTIKRLNELMYHS